MEQRVRPGPLAQPELKVIQERRAPLERGANPVHLATTGRRALRDQPDLKDRPAPPGRRERPARQELMAILARLVPRDLPGLGGPLVQPARPGLRELKAMLAQQALRARRGYRGRLGRQVPPVQCRGLQVPLAQRDRQGLTAQMDRTGRTRPSTVSMR